MYYLLVDTKHLEWLAHLVRRLDDNTRVICWCNFKFTAFPFQNYCDISRMTSVSKSKSIIINYSNSNSQGSKSHWTVVWSLQAVRVKILDSHLTYKVANKFLNVRKRVGLKARNKDGLLPSAVCLVIPQCMWEKTLHGMIYSSNLGVGRVMPSRRPTQGATVVGAEGQNFQNCWKLRTTCSNFFV